MALKCFCPVVGRSIYKHGSATGQYVLVPMLMPNDCLGTIL